MIDGDATVLDAGVEMARRRCRHLLVREPDGPVVSVVSERDIFRIQQQGIVQVFHPIDTANSVEEIATLAGRIVISVKESFAREWRSASSPARVVDQ
ncbi:MAG: hypothetical protein IPK39_18380 [Sulfuritalea sp.]|nr:hypothetical protein [Sulfuritalea sp.]